jgi:hypothetical protein
MELGKTTIGKEKKAPISKGCPHKHLRRCVIFKG